MVEQPLPGVRIDAPCLRCAALWVSPEDPELEPFTPLVGGPPDPKWMTKVSDDEGNGFSGPFYPHPECGRHIALPRGEGTFLAQGAFSPIKRLVQRPHFPGGPAMVLCSMDPPRRRERGLGMLLGSGIDEDPSLAVKKAVSEALERYCALSPPRTTFRRTTSAELCDRIPHGLPSGAREPAPRWWGKVRRMETQEEAFLPLEYLELESVCAVKDPLVRTDSTGIALHPDPDAAFEGALLEVFERSALWSLWTGRIPQIHGAEVLPNEVQSLVRACASIGYAPSVLRHDEPELGITTCAVLLQRVASTPGPALVCGSGAGFAPTLALRRAFEEAVGMLDGALELWAQPAEAPRALQDGFVRYFDPEQARGLLSAWGFSAAPRALSFATEAHGTVQIVRERTAIYAVDRGNVLTDFLGLTCIHVLVPDRPLLRRDGGGPPGWSIPFA